MFFEKEVFSDYSGYSSLILVFIATSWDLPADPEADSFFQCRGQEFDPVRELRSHMPQNVVKIFKS